MVTAQVTFSKKELVANLQSRSPLTMFGVSWSDYEKISAEFGESSSFLVSYRRGILKIMPLTKIHEILASLLHDFVRFAGLHLKINVVATGNATMRSKKKAIGLEPDASYYIKRANQVEMLDYVPNELDLPPDIVIEIDVHHGSEDKFEIYAEFDVPEFWRYENGKLQMFKLRENGAYEEIERSEQLPVLTDAILTEFLRRGLNEEQFVVLTDFQNWLQANK